jgi:hypothetical protein
MIKDRSTPELKNRMLQEIQKTTKDENEHGFLICTDNKGNLSATESCKGDECEINFENLMNKCPYKVQGDFHTHSHIAVLKMHIEKIPRIAPLDEYHKKAVIENTKKSFIENKKKNNETLTEPSHLDILSAIKLKYNGRALGTVCTGVDLDENTVECWTAKGNITRKDFDRASQESHQQNSYPKEWVKPLFQKEIISLK